MARPHPDDLALCVQGALGVGDLTSVNRASRRVICNVVGQHYYNGWPTIFDMQDALGAQTYVEWVEGSNVDNCTMALAMYKKTYPEG